MKNVLFIESGVFGGGSFVSLVKHLKALDTEKIRPIVVFFNKTAQYDIISKMNIDVYLVEDDLFSKGGNAYSKFINALFMKGFLPFFIIELLRFIHRNSIREIKKLCVEKNIDYIHLNTEIFRDRVGVLVGMSLGIPVISHLRSKYDLSKIGRMTKYISFANKVVEKYICVSKETLEFWTNNYGIHQNSHVLYDYFPESISNNLHKTNINDQVLLLCPANLIPVKGHEFLLRAIASKLKSGKVKLLLPGVGEKKYEDSLLQLSKDLGISDNVEFLGFRDDMRELMINSHIIVLPSKREGLPNAIIEAMGLGCIVIASNVGGLPEIIKNNKNGFLFNYGNSIELENQIEYVIDNYSKFNEIRQAAKKTILSYFSIENYKFKIRDFYE